MLDNGSAVTLVGQESIRKLSIPASSISRIHLPLNTVNGPVGASDRLNYSGMMVRPIRMPGCEWNLSCCVEIDRLLPSNHEVPTEPEVRSIPELSHLSRDFPPAQETWDTILLIGRDNVWAMEIKKQIFPEQPGQPAAVKTHLGWALMGPKVRNHASRVQNLNHSVHASPGIMQVQVSQTEGPRLCPVLQ